MRRTDPLTMARAALSMAWGDKLAGTVRGPPRRSSSLLYRRPWPASRHWRASRRAARDTVRFDREELFDQIEHLLGSGCGRGLQLEEHRAAPPAPVQSCRSVQHVILMPSRATPRIRFELP